MQKDLLEQCMKLDKSLVVECIDHVNGNYNESRCMKEESHKGF